MDEGAEVLGRGEETLEDGESGLGVCLAPFGGAGVPLYGC